jgi:hypothetical protein
MKTIILALTLIGLSTNANTMEYGNYICTTDKISGVSEAHSKAFGIKNGNIKPNDRNKYSVSYTKSKLFFQNLSNKAKIVFSHSGKKDEFDRFHDNWFEFRVSTSNNDFEFIVAKANYYAKYLGTCNNVSLTEPKLVHRDGFELLKECQSKEYSTKLLCSAYIIGATDALTGVGKKSPYYKFCIPPKTPIGQIVQTVKTWLPNNSKYLKFAGPSVIALALSEKFPCK